MCHFKWLNESVSVSREINADDVSGEAFDALEMQGVAVCEAFREDFPLEAGVSCLDAKTQSLVLSCNKEGRVARVDGRVLEAVKSYGSQKSPRCSRVSK